MECYGDSPVAGNIRSGKNSAILAVTVSSKGKRPLDRHCFRMTVLGDQMPMPVRGYGGASKGIIATESLH